MRMVPWDRIRATYWLLAPPADLCTGWVSGMALCLCIVSSQDSRERLTAMVVLFDGVTREAMIPWEDYSACERCRRGSCPASWILRLITKQVSRYKNRENDKCKFIYPSIILLYKYYTWRLYSNLFFLDVLHRWDWDGMAWCFFCPAIGVSPRVSVCHTGMIHMFLAGGYVITKVFFCMFPLRYACIISQLPFLI